MIRSFSYSQDEILNSIKKLYCPEGFECDITYGNGVFWKTIEKPKLRFDISPQTDDTTEGDSRCLPLESDSLNNIIFDPPFLTYIKNGRNHKDGKMIMAARFGGYWRYSELENHYYETFLEAKRILKKKGYFIVKCQDIIHNHRMHCTHNLCINYGESIGLRLEDLFVLAAKHKMSGPQKGKQRHARIWQSYFLVFKKVKNDSRPPNQ